MRVKEGDYAPNISVVDIHGRQVELTELKGSKIILGFFRNVGCPFCNRRVHQIMGNTVRLEKLGVKVLFVFESSSDKLLSSVFHEGVSPWPLIGDPEKKLYRKYGVEESMFKMMRTMISSSVSQAKKDTAELNLPEDKDASMTLIPADFFIDENLKIVRAHYGKHLDDHVPMEDFKRFAGL